MCSWFSLGETEEHGTLFKGLDGRHDTERPCTVMGGTVTCVWKTPGLTCVLAHHICFIPAVNACKFLTNLQSLVSNHLYPLP